MSEQNSEAQSGRAPKGRSPSYPGVPLSVAVRRAQALYERAHRHPMPIGGIAKLWGYKSPNTGPASVTYAALKKFGLLEDEGTGNDRMARLTDLAAEIILKPDPLPAVQQAALRPLIHQEMWEAYGADLPPDDTLRWELVGQRGFTTSGFEEFIRQYRETLNYARLPESGRLGSEDESPEDETDGSSSDGQTDRGTSIRDGAQRRTGMKDDGVLSIPVPVVGAAPIIVEGRFPVSEAAWNQFMAVLTAMKPGLVAEPDRREPSDPEA
jgi:hypothetical protein